MEEEYNYDERDDRNRRAVSDNPKKRNNYREEYWRTVKAEERAD